MVSSGRLLFVFFVFVLFCFFSFILQSFLIGRSNDATLLGSLKAEFVFLKADVRELRDELEEQAAEIGKLEEAFQTLDRRLIMQEQSRVVASTKKSVKKVSTTKPTIKLVTGTKTTLVQAASVKQESMAPKLLKVKNLPLGLYSVDVEFDTFPFWLIGNYTAKQCDMIGPWREPGCETRKNLYEKFDRVNNPKVCPKSWELGAVFCTLAHNTGFGHHLHIFGHCLTKSVIENKATVLEEKWGYAVNCNNPHVWTCFMEPILGCTGLDLEPKVVRKFNYSNANTDYASLAWPPSAATAYWQGTPDLTKSAKKANPKPEILLKALTMRYLFRPNADVHSFVAQNFETVKSKLKRPYAAIHVRRTDKIGSEAKLHAVWEYMEHVDYFFENLQGGFKGSGKRTLFVATDEGSVLLELQKDYGHKYEIINFAKATETANLRKGNPFAVFGEGTKFLILDIMLCANADFFVGTFSSQISRIVYELKTSRIPNNGYLRARKMEQLEVGVRTFPGKERFFQTAKDVDPSAPIVAASLDDWWYYG